MYYGSPTTSPNQEEKHLALLKQLLQQESNRNCFECNQRGPTYVDVTIGSFVCTFCGGILRGLNSPHRVKSISMASFSPSEIAFIELKGNDYCKKIYMGNYEKDPLQPEPEFQDPVKVKMFLEQKYVQKRWYVSPEDASKPLDSFMKSVSREKWSDKTASVVSNSITTVSSAPDATTKQVHGNKSSVSTGISSNVSSLTSSSAKPELSSAGFANFNQAFPSQNFDPFGSFSSEQTSATSADSTLTTTAFGDFSQVLAPSSTSLGEKAQITKSSDKYADLGDIFKIEASSSEKSTNLWAEFDSPPIKGTNSSNCGLSNAQQPRNYPGTWQTSSEFNFNSTTNFLGSSHNQPASTNGNVQFQQAGTTGIVNQSNSSVFSQPSFTSTSIGVPASFAAPAYNVPSFSAIHNPGNVAPAAAGRFQAFQPLSNSVYLNAAPALPNPFELPLNSKQPQTINTNPFVPIQSNQNPRLPQPSANNPFATQTNFSTNTNQLPTNPFF